MTCIFPWGLGVDFFAFGERGLACLPCARLTYAVIYLFLTFLTFWFLGVLLSGRDGYHIFKDLEAETIHVCIAWALLQYLGLVFHACCTLFFYCLFFGYSLLFYFLYIGSGMGDTRYSLLPCHGCSGWLGLVASETMGLRSCFLF